MSTRKRLIIGIVISVAFWGLASWDVNWDIRFQQLASAKIALLVFAAGAFTLSIVARAMNWGHNWAP